MNWATFFLTIGVLGCLAGVMAGAAAYIEDIPTRKAWILFGASVLCLAIGRGLL